MTKFCQLCKTSLEEISQNIILHCGQHHGKKKAIYKTASVTYGWAGAVMVFKQLFSTDKPTDRQNKLQRKTRPFTQQHQLRAGGQGQCDIWAGASTQICAPFSSKHPKTRSDYGRMDGLTDQPTDRHSDIWSCVPVT